MMFQLQMFFNCTWHDNLATNRQQLQLLLLISYGFLTAVPSENYCMSLGPYEWPVLHAVSLSQYLFSFTAGMVQRKPQQANGSPTCELQLFTSTWMCCRIDTGCLQNNSYPQLRSESLLQWHVHVQHISTLESQA